MYLKHSSSLRRNIYSLGRFNYYTRVFYCDNSYEDIPLYVATYEELRNKYKEQKRDYSKDTFINLKKIKKYGIIALMSGIISYGIIALILNGNFSGIDMIIQLLMATPPVLTNIYSSFIVFDEMEIIFDKIRTGLQLEIEDLVVEIADIDKAPQTQSDKEDFFSKHAFDGSDYPNYSIEYYRKKRETYIAIREKLLKYDEKPSIIEPDIRYLPINRTPCSNHTDQSHGKILNFPGRYSHDAHHRL